MRQQGISLIELVIMIIIIGISTTALMHSFSQPLQDSPQLNKQIIAQNLARERIELIIGQARHLGFNTLNINNFDPCLNGSTDISCTNIPNGYTINTQLQNYTIGTDNGYHRLIVTVSGEGAIELQTLVSNYDYT